MRRVDHVNYKGQWAPFGSIIKADSIRTTVAQIRRMSLLFVQRNRGKSLLFVGVRDGGVGGGAVRVKKKHVRPKKYRSQKFRTVKNGEQ